MTILVKKLTLKLLNCKLETFLIEHIYSKLPILTKPMMILFLCRKKIVSAISSVISKKKKATYPVKIDVLEKT